MEGLNNRGALLETVRGLREELDRVVTEAGAERIEEAGSFGDWTFKDVIAHLTGWRQVTAARLEAGLRHEEPVFPWPAGLDEEDNVDAINNWFYEASRDKPLAEVLRESEEAFARVEQAIEAMPEEDLLGPGRFAWLHWTDEALGPAVVRGTHGHYHGEHGPTIREWLARR
jgi:hypothetical protein